MKKSNKALLIGNYRDAFYHPLNIVENAIKDILKNDFELVCTENLESLQAEALADYDLCISYADFWEKKLDSQKLAGIVSFVCGGKGLLAIHTGISYQKNYEYAQMIGARFTDHPPIQRLDFHMTAIDHPIVNAIDDFSCEDEPYQFEMDNFSEKTILFEYELNGMNKPAGWALEYGIGRVVYLMPGHSVTPFLNATYRQIILNSALWLVKNK